MPDAQKTTLRDLRAEVVRQSELKERWQRHAANLRGMLIDAQRENLRLRSELDERKIVDEHCCR